MAGNYYQRSPRLDQHEPQPRSAHLASTGAATQSIRPLPTPSSSGYRQPNSNPSFDHAPSSSSSRNPSPFLNRDDGGAAVAGPSQGRRAASEMQSQRERENAYGAVRSGSQTLSPNLQQSGFRAASPQSVPPRPPIVPVGHPASGSMMSPGASSSSSSSGGASFRSQIASPPPQRPPLPDGSIVVATSDLESLVVVPLGGRTSPEAIRESIMVKLHIADDDFFRYKLFLTSIGAVDHGRPVLDEELWDVCRRGLGPGQVVFAQCLVPAHSSSGSRDAADWVNVEDLPAGISAERLRHMGKERARARDREREREGESGHSTVVASPVSNGSAGGSTGGLARRGSPTTSSKPSPSTSGDLGEASRQERHSGSLRSDRPSWVHKGDGHARRSSAGGMSPPPVREGSNTPTGASIVAEERLRHNGEWAQSPPPQTAGGSAGYSSGNHSSLSPPGSSHQIVMGPSGPTRRLPPQPPAPPVSHKDGVDSQRNRTMPPAQTDRSTHFESQSWPRKYASESTASSSSTGPQPSLQGTAPSAALPPTLTRPLASTDPRNALPQYQSWSPSPANSNTAVFHNIALQQGGEYSSYTTQGGSHLSPNPNGSRSAMASKSVDNLRGSYTVSQGPPIPPQIPAQYRSTIGSRVQPPSAGSSQPFKQGSYPPVFDPRIMNTSLQQPPATAVGASPASAFYRTPINAPTSTYSAYSALSHSPMPTSNQGFTSPNPQSRPYTSVPQQQRRPDPTSTWYAQPPQPPRLPDMSRHIDLKPGEVLKSVTPSGSNIARPHRTNDGLGIHQAPDAVNRPSSAKTVAVGEFGSMDDGFARDRHGHSAPMRRGASAGVSHPDQRSASAGPLPASLRAGGKNGRERDSGSSFASARSDIISSSSSAASSSPARGPRRPSGPPGDDSDAYGGMRDDVSAPQSNRNAPRSNFNSPPSSTRSSASGPLTPAQDPTPPPHVVVASVDEFGDPLDDDGGATWFPVNQPASVKPRTATTESSNSSRRLSVQDDEAGTARAHEWAEAVMKRLGSNDADSEATLMRTLQRAPKAQDAKPARHLDEFGDDLDDEGGTFFPGYGPNRPAITTHAPSRGNTPLASPLIGAVPREEERTRSPGENKRPNLRLRIEDQPSQVYSQPPTSSSDAAAHSSASEGRRAAAVGEPGDLAASLSTRRTDRARGGEGRSGDSLMSLRPTTDGSPRSQVSRRNSFRAREEEQDWAIRPAVETVLENLDVFFPNVDLDKPVFDLPTPAPSTPSPVRDTTKESTSSGSSAVTTPSSTHSMLPPAALPVPKRRSFSPTRESGGANLGHKKSIRVVAQDRKRAMQRAGRNVVTAVSGLSSNLLRRKSTKLFGARIEEVTSAQLGNLHSTIKEMPDDDPENFSYKWIKGDLIGRGTFGHVYIGFSVNTGETIAVKQVELPRSQHEKDDARTKSMVQSLKAEIELLKDLDHPNIVLYLGMEETREHLSIFLEYVPGGSIGRIVRTHGKFEENVIKFFTAQILEGLEYLHSLGIVHRDMKADNILTDHDGMCKISDFGTSKKSADIYNNNENMSMQGSIFWMAPEVIHNKNQGYSAKADIWSLGCILIEMFAGRRPWSDEEAIQAMFKLGAERLAPPVPADVTLSDTADSFLKDCLQIDSNLRPKAVHLQTHPFLQLEEDWSFTQTDLYRVMANEEARRRAITAPPT